MTDSWMCSIDGRTAATRFCCCQGREIFMCEEHIAKHMDQFPTMHHILPNGAFGQHTIPDYFESLKKRAAVKEAAKTELERNVGLFDKCIQEFEEKMELAMWNLIDYSQKALVELRTLKKKMQSDIAEAIAEAEQCHYLHTPDLKSNITATIRSFVAEQNQLVLFRYRVFGNACPFLVAEVMKYEVLSPCSDPSLRPELKPEKELLTAVNEKLTSDLKSKESKQIQEITTLNTNILNLNSEIRRLNFEVENLKRIGNSNSTIARLNLEIGNMRRLQRRY